MKRHIAASGNRAGQWVTCNATGKCPLGGAHISNDVLYATRKWKNEGNKEYVPLREVTAEDVARFNILPDTYKKKLLNTSEYDEYGFRNSSGKAYTTEEIESYNKAIKAAAALLNHDPSKHAGHKEKINNFIESTHFIPQISRSWVRRLILVSGKTGPENALDREEIRLALTDVVAQMRNNQRAGLIVSKRPKTESQGTIEDAAKEALGSPIPTGPELKEWANKLFNGWAIKDIQS